MKITSAILFAIGIVLMAVGFVAGDGHAAAEFLWTTLEKGEP